MLIFENNKYFRICDICNDQKEIKIGTYKSYLKKEKHLCVSCNQKLATEAARKKQVWNKGLTKNDDERIKKYSTKISIKNKGKSAWNKGLTKNDDKRIKKYSISNSKTKKGYYHTLQYFLDKYGDQGIIKYKELNNKKAITLKNMVNKYGQNEGKIRYENYKKDHQNKMKFSSSISQELFFELLKSIENKDDIYFDLKNKEFGKMSIKDNTYYFYDFADIKNKKIIEFNGDIFHANPKKFIFSDKPNPFNKNITSKDIWEKDFKKINFIKNEDMMF